MKKSPFCKKCRMLIIKGTCNCNRKRLKANPKQRAIHYGHSRTLCRTKGKEALLTTDENLVTCERCKKIL